MSKFRTSNARQLSPTERDSEEADIIYATDLAQQQLEWFDRELRKKIADNKNAEMIDLFMSVIISDLLYKYSKNYT